MFCIYMYNIQCTVLARITVHCTWRCFPISEKNIFNNFHADKKFERFSFSMFAMFCMIHISIFPFVSNSHGALKAVCRRQLSIYDIGALNTGVEWISSSIDVFAFCKFNIGLGCAFVLRAFIHQPFIWSKVNIGRGTFKICFLFLFFFLFLNYYVKRAFKVKIVSLKRSNEHYTLHSQIKVFGRVMKLEYSKIPMKLSKWKISENF